MSVSINDYSLDESETSKYLEYLNDTAKIAGEYQANCISNVITAIVSDKSAATLTNNVEFWAWMDRNYSKSGIFSSNQSMKNYINTPEGLEWVTKQIQGKGFEWDWMTAQRNNLRNIACKFYAGDVSNRALTDVTKTNLLTKKFWDSQMKAYTSNNLPDINNIPENVTIIVNKEKVSALTKTHNNVQGFQSTPKIKKNVNKRINQIESGKATPQYNIKNVGLTMLSAGLVSAVVSASIEGFTLWKSYKAGDITKEEYLIEIAKSAGEGALIGSATAGIMIPIGSVLTLAGLSAAPITIPISIIISATLGKIIAPIFKRGDYLKILQEAKYYQGIVHLTDNLVISMYEMQDQLLSYVEESYRHNDIQKYYDIQDSCLNSKINQVDSFIDYRNSADNQTLSDIEKIIDQI